MLPQWLDTLDDQKRTAVWIESQPEPQPFPQPEAVLEVVVNEPPQPESEPQTQYFGRCRITVYCGCSKCCGKWAENRPLDAQGTPIVIGANGEVLTSGVSVASSLPFGTRLMLSGMPDTYVVQDRPAKHILQKYDNYIIDVYFTNHDQAYRFVEVCGDYREVYILV